MDRSLLTFGQQIGFDHDFPRAVQLQPALLVGCTDARRPRASAGPTHAHRFHDITRGIGGYHLHTGALKRLGDSAAPGTAEHTIGGMSLGSPPGRSVVD
jgi:hypothetical protein